MTADENIPEEVPEASAAELHEATVPAPADGTDREAPAELPDQGESISRLRSLWLPAGLLLLVTVGLNWPYQHVFTSVRSIGKIDSVVDFPSVSASPPVVGGWPYRFLVRHPTEAGDSIERFSVIALLYNLGLAVVVCAFLLWYGHRRSKRGDLGKANLSIADLMLVTGLLAAPFAWWQHSGSRADEEIAFAKRVQRQGGACRLSSSVPSFLQERLPNEFLLRLRRIRSVRLEQGTDPLVHEIVQLPELTQLRLGGGDYALNRIEQIVASAGIEDLRIAGRQLEAASYQEIRGFVRLHTLNLMRTNVNSQAINQLDTMPNLKRLNLIHSDLVTADLESPPWSSTITELRLSHPEPGDEASLRIVGWPELKNLEVNELESQMNSTTMKVDLQDLPKLESLGLDLFQKFDLKLSNLAALKRIKELDYEWSARVSRRGKAPGQIWVGRLDIDGLPELDDLKFFTPGLKYLRVVNSPKIALAGVGAFFRTHANQVYAPELTEEAAKALIEGLGQSEGPETVDLDAVPLKGVDLSALAGNKQLTRLKLSYSGTELEQWKQLATMTWLKELTIQGNEGSWQAVPWVLKTFPNLEHLAFSSGASGSGYGYYSRGVTDRFEVVDRPNLKTIDMGDVSMGYASGVRVVNSPNLKMPIKVGHVSELELVDANGLTGVSVAGVFPPNAKLKGLDNLTFFAAGGPTVTDESIQAIQACQKLTQLTLAYPAVTEEGLEGIKNFQSLHSLHLPGAALADEVVAKWGTFNSLSRLDLSDTKITAKSVAKLVSGALLERVVLDRTAVVPTELGCLTKLPHLSHLSLAGVGIDAKTLDAIFDSGRLQELDLSDSEVTPEVLNVIAAKGSSLRFLALRNCELDEKGLVAVVAKNSILQLDITAANASTQTMTRLLSSGRITTMQEIEMQRAMNNMTSQNPMGGGFTMFEPEYPGLIDTRVFANMKAQGIGAPRQPASSQQVSEQQVSEQRSFGFQFGNWLGSAIRGTQPATVVPSTDVEVELVEEVEAAQPQEVSP